MNDLPPPLGHNNPPVVDPAILDAAKAKVSEWADAAGEWLVRGRVDTDADASDLKDMIDGSRKVGKAIEDARKKAKEPHTEAAKAVDAAFRPLTAAMEKVVERLRPILTDFLGRKEAEECARRAEMAAEAERQRQEAARLAAAAAERNDVLGETAAQLAAAEAEKLAEVAAAEVKVSVASASGGGSRATALRSRRVVGIDNLALAFLEVKDHPGVIEAIQSALNARVNRADWPADGTLRGCTIGTVRTAA